MITNKFISNMVGGEISPLMGGRSDLPIYGKSMERLTNFIALPQGPIRNRCGSMFVRYTRLNKKARFIPFQFSDRQSYLIEATDKKFRFYKDNGVITESAKAITAATNANPGVFTIVGHGYATGDELYITGLVGMSGINGKTYLINVLSVDTFSLTDIFGTVIDTTLSGTRTSGGTAARIYEITTPYIEADLNTIQFSQNADTMYFAHQNYEPRKLTRSGHANWTLATYTRTSDPFTSATVAITAITQASPGVVSAGGHAYANGNIVRIDSVVGMTELNDKVFVVANVVAGTSFTLVTLEGIPVDTTSYTNYSSGGNAVLAANWPRAVTFNDSGRLIFGGSRNNPESVWASKAPSTGTTAFDNFTTGTNATDAVTFTLAPQHGKVDAIIWLTNTGKFAVIGTYSTIRRLYGGTETDPISPTSVTAKSVNSFGCEETLPISNGSSLFYVQRSGRILRSLEYDIAVEGYVTVDRNLVATHLTQSGIKQIVEQQGSPEINWACRNDGRFLGLTFKDKEDISGWHQHYLGGSHVNDNGVTMPFARVLWIGNMPRPRDPDQVWFIVERKIGANTVRSVEYLADLPEFPLELDYYSSESTEDEDGSKFLNIKYETQKNSVYLDMAASYDGSAYGTYASATLTPAAVTGTGIVLTASAAVFTSDMVDRQIWKGYDQNGDGGGRAIITAYTDSTHVTVEIIKDFDNTNAIAAGAWFITATSVTGLEYLEGQEVGIVADGGVHAVRTVSGGSVTLQYPASKIHVGYKVRAFASSLNLDPGTQTGPAQAKNRNLIKACFRFLDTGGVRFGTYQYDTERLVFRSTNDLVSRPTPIFSGIREERYMDTWNIEGKKFFVLQDQALPCTLLSVDLFMDTVDE